jgi:hypothetical protein
MQVMQIGPFVAARIVSMAMRAIHLKQMPLCAASAVSSGDCVAA